MAARFWVGGGSSAAFNATAPTNWALTSGGANNQTVPGSSDDVTFDGVGANGNTACNMTASVSCLTMVFTSGYTSTITVTSAVVISVSGTVFTDNSAHTWTLLGTGTLLLAGTCTITGGGKTWPGNVNFNGTLTKTLSGNWTVAGTCTITTGGTVTLNKTGGSDTLTTSGLTVTGNLAGNANITFNGGQWAGSGTNTLTGTITFTGNTSFSSATIHVNGCTLVNSGTTFTANNSNLTIDGATTFNTSGMTFNGVTINASVTVTINSLLSAAALTIQNAISPTFAGTAGWMITTFTGAWSSTGGTVTLVNGVTYTITSTFTCQNSRTGQVTFTSDHATNKAILILNQGATCNVLASFTRIDASGGRPILSFNGTITTCTNVFAYTDVQVPPQKYFRHGRRQALLNRTKAVIYQ